MRHGEGLPELTHRRDYLCPIQRVRDCPDGRATAEIPDNSYPRGAGGMVSTAGDDLRSAKAIIAKQDPLANGKP